MAPRRVVQFGDVLREIRNLIIVGQFQRNHGLFELTIWRGGLRG
jgi:hypothetical protein